MTGMLKDMTIGLDGKQNITVSIQDTDFREEYESLKNKKVTIDIKEFRNHRSLDANAYAWTLIDSISKAMHISKSEVYRKAIREIGGVSEIVCVIDRAVKRLQTAWEHNGLGWQTETMPSKLDGCTNVVLYYGSSVYDTKQMSSLIDQLIHEAEQLGIQTMTPKELARLMEQYEQQKERTYKNGRKEEGNSKNQPHR